MKKTVTDQRIAAAEMAYRFSDVIEFDSKFFSDARAKLENNVDNREQNLFGQQTKIMNCEGTEDVTGFMFGAMKGGAVASAFLKDTGALNVNGLVGKYCANDLPAVFYLATDDANVCTYNFCKEVGMVFPSNAQEAADLSVLAHLSIGKSYKPFVVCLNNRAQASKDEEVELPENSDINKLFDVVAFCGTRARALKRGISCDIEVPVLLEAELPEIVDHYLGKINEEWGRAYRLIDYIGAADAETVFVSAGSETDVMEKAIAELVADGEKVGLIKIKVLAPFNEAAFRELFPATCKKAVLIGQGAGSCPNNPFYKLISACVPGIVWGDDEYSLGRNDVSERFVKDAVKALSAEAPQSHKDDAKYFAQAMDAKYYQDVEKILNLGEKRWVVANSIGVNNVNFGLGMTAAFEQRRDWILNEVLFLADNTIFPSVSARGYEYLEAKDDTEKSLDALTALLDDHVREDTHCSTCTNIRSELEFLDKKYYWVYGGDSRKAPIDWCAIKKALYSGENVNIFCVQDKAIYKKAAEHTGAKDLFFTIKNVDGVLAKTITLDMEPEKIEGLLHQAETHFGPSIVVLFV